MDEENLGKLQPRDRLTKAVRPVIASNGIRYLKMTTIGPYSMSRREKKEIKEGRLV